MHFCKYCDKRMSGAHRQHRDNSNFRSKMQIKSDNLKKMNYPSKYLNADMSPFFKEGSPAELIAKQMDFLYEEGKKLDINYEDVSVDLEIQRELEKDMFDEEYTKEEMEAAEARAEMAWDAHKEECPKVDHEDCF